MYNITLKARGQQFEYACAPNVTPLEQLVTSLFQFQLDVFEVVVGCAR